MGDTIPQPLGLGAIEKWAEQVRENRSVSSISPWFLVQFPLLGSCLDLFPWFP